MRARPEVPPEWNLEALTVDQASAVLNCSPSLIYRDIKREVLDCDIIGENGKRLSWSQHLIPYLERKQTKNPRPQRLSGKKATLKHLSQ